MKDGTFWIVIVEDNPKDAARLKVYIDRYISSQDVAAEVTVYGDGRSLLQNYREQIDILFLDIELPQMNGMTVAEKVREQDPFVSIIFMTNMAQYALKGYEVEALGFIVKPASYFLFEKYIAKAIAVSRKNERLKANNIVTLGTDSHFKRVRTDDIVYIIKEKNYIVYYTMNEPPFRERGTMKDILDRFENTTIKQCASGCMVNLQYVSKKVGNDVMIAGQTFSITLPFRKSFTQELMDYMRGV